MEPVTARMKPVKETHREQSFLPSGTISVLLLLALLAGLFAATPTSAAPQKSYGKISGKLIDAATGDPLIGANVIIEGLPLGGASDQEGVFLIDKVPPGEYTLAAAMIGYAETKLSKVTVRPGKITVLDKIGLKEELIGGREVLIEARFIKETEAAILAERRKSFSISDGLSAEAISHSGSSNAAEAMQQLTGASVVGGKYVYLRGLGERYASTQLNGVELPSADPDKRSFNFDLVPAEMLDNIVATKTFTPDQAGNFSGGVVNLRVRTYPDKFSIHVSSGLSVNTQTSLNSNFLGYRGGNHDWLGFDDGTRQLPAELANRSGNIPREVEARRDAELAARLNQYSRAFTPVMAPVRDTAPVNNSFSISIGNKTRFAGKPLGYFGSFSYSRNYSFYDNGEVGRWKLTGNVDRNDSLAQLIKLRDSNGSENVLWGGMAALAFHPDPDHEIQLNLLRTQSGVSQARYLAGPWPEQNVQNFETRVLSYKERALTSWQVRGSHNFNKLKGLDLNWIGSSARSRQQEPDVRFFSDTFFQREFNGRDTTIYSISPSIIRRPGRYFRDLKEDSRSIQADLRIAVMKQPGRFESALKLGYRYEEKDRTFDEQLFEYWQGAGARYTGDPEAFFSSENTGIIGFDSTRNVYRFGNYIQEALGGFRGNYRGSQRINAAYAMLDVRLLKQLRLVGGARYEAARMSVQNQETTGRLVDDDLLPSINLTYLMQNNMNFRLAYGKTLARPNFREKAPYANFEFVADYIFNGNPDLQRTLIDNYDLRWEWFFQPGEVLAISGFRKNFKNPIERTIDVGFSSEGAVVFFDNVEKASVSGLELELRKRLGFLSPLLRRFLLAGNLSLIRSRVRIPERELISIRGVDPKAGNRRELQGQSPFLANLSLVYENSRRGTVASLYYNVFGKRLSEVSLGGTPGVYEQPRHILNLTLAQRLFESLSIKIGAKNLLDESHRFTQTFKNVEYIRRVYKSGRSFSLGLQYKLK